MSTLFLEGDRAALAEALGLTTADLDQMTLEQVLALAADAGLTQLEVQQLLAPAFVLGFAQLQALVGAPMGGSISPEFADPHGTGDVHQETTNGLAFWRKDTNTPTFTNGWEHWALTEKGLVYWVGDSIEPPTN